MRNEEEEEECNGVIGSSVVYGVGTLYGATIVQLPSINGGLYLAKPYSAKPYSAVQESAKPYSAKPYSAKPYSAKPTSGI